jgi:hypothetical protein
MSDGSPPAHQGRQGTTKGGIQALDVGGVDDRPRVGLAQNLCTGLSRPLHDSVSHTDDPAPFATSGQASHTVDHLTDEQPWFYHQPWPPTSTCSHGMTEHPPKGCDVTGEAIHTDQNRQALSTCTDSAHQCGDQPAVTMLTNDPTQLQARGHREGHGHPDPFPDQFDP